MHYLVTMFTGFFPKSVTNAPRDGMSNSQPQKGACAPSSTGKRSPLATSPAACGTVRPKSTTRKPPSPTTPATATASVTYSNATPSASDVKKPEGDNLRPLFVLSTNQQARHILL